MSHRVGICSSCEANYKVPADFAADKAKCKECGGIVEIGDVVDDPSPPPVPAKPVRMAEPDLVEHVPSGKKEEGPSMMEKILAQRAVERDTQGAGAAAATPTPKPAAKSKEDTISSIGAPTAKATSRRATPSRSTRPSRSRRRGRGGDEEDEGDEEETGRGTRGRKKKSPVPLICTLVLVVAGGGTGAYLMLKGDPVDPVVAAKESIRALVDTQIRAANAEDRDAYIATRDPKAYGDFPSYEMLIEEMFEKWDLKTTLVSLEFVSVEETEAKARMTVETTKLEGPLFPDARTTTLNTFTKSSGSWLFGEAVQEKIELLAGEVVAGADADSLDDAVEAPPEEVKKPKPTSNPKVKDPMEVDLASLEDFGAAPGCSASDWGQIQEDAALLVDPQAGAAGGRAGKRLQAEGRNAIPALINVFKTREMGTDAGFRDGDVLQRTLQEIYNGKNFGWKYTTEPNDHWYNRKVVENHWKLWDKYQSDEAGWLKFTGLDKEGVEPSGAGDDLSTDELDALDDI